VIQQSGVDKDELLKQKEKENEEQKKVNEEQRKEIEELKKAKVGGTSEVSFLSLFSLFFPFSFLTLLLLICRVRKSGALMR